MSGAEHFKVVGDLWRTAHAGTEGRNRRDSWGKKRFAVAVNAFSTDVMVIQFLSL
ncbi:hypothetical protein JET14_05455 [Martelella lutilitoris]|uniref:Uncharacterized protein n=1 Tax=Martelella lutilitoris TaxID=2583532 RepID=A0A7T7HLY2_9HYPH|nr:hypothetical protein [Martelella lutilitoris]QQM31618.1 hypothetical protein JET14_05455 [Martelella lutilitoris]